MTAARIHSRVYHEIVDDPLFEEVYGNDRALAAWLRMLIVADAMYPASAPMPARTPGVRLLIEKGLVEERAGNRYTIRGLAAERERRSQLARNAANARHGVRTDSTSNADALQTHSGRIASKEEKRREEKSNGANAPDQAPVFLGFPPKKPAKLTEEQIASFRRNASESRDPLIRQNARETLERAGVPVEAGS